MASQNSFGKALASADKSVRDKAVKKLSKYLSNKKDLSDLDLLKLWKGLFYCFWMSDKPLVQQQLSEKLASLILKIPDEIALKFVEAFWKEIRLEWNGIDRLRLDKFYYLFRQMHLNSFKYLEKVNWDTTHVIKYMDIYTDGPLRLLDQTAPPSLLYHACEVFIPELNKAITKPIPTSVFIEILEPFFDVVGFCSNDILVERVIEELFLNIVNIYENEDANEEEESNIIKSCNFKLIYKRLEKLSEEALVLKKNLEHIDDLIVIFKGLSETQEVLQDSIEEENEEEEEEEENEESENENNTFDIINDDSEEVKMESVKSKSKTKGKGKGKGKSNTSNKGKKDVKKEEESIEIKETSKKVKNTNKKRKAEVEPIEIEEEEAVIIVSPKQKKNNSAKKSPTKKAKKTKKEESPIVISESDEEVKSPPKIRKSKRLNQKKTAK
ncbi:Nop52-domain-containing protein [Anaeromyces robustus]|uniref:Nop52-domain-containing protein n=1 Tax=Anaeromyces robustus TaxID=1754192 RepID=A0A1Y1XF94_9FUNG|nr:Nop52-domain-containing protein [Anaeromyces robustus]|eukprot:ORX84418.1 Nop52-domain-containing protein [Anaeromyces robustus]